MSSWRPSGDPTAFTRFKYEMPQVDFSPPRRRTHQPPRNPKLPLANVAARRSPEELLLGALADMRQAMSQTEQCLNNVVLETRQDARDEATRLWKALGKEPPPPPGSQDHMSNAAEAAWHKKQKQRLRAIEERIELRNNEAAELRMRLRALGDDDFPIDGDGIHSMAAAASHPLDTVGAATRVQAHARGHQARQRGKDLRRGEPLSHSSPPRKTQGGAGRIKGVPFRAEGVPSRFESRRPSTPPSEKLDRALAAREAALDRELASFAPSAPGLPDNPSSDDEWRAVSWRLRDLPSHWLPPIDESAASSSEVREAMSVMQAGLSSLLGGVGEDDDEGDDVRVHSADEHAQMGKRAEAEAREALARAQFEMYDANGNGSIEMSELTKLLADTLGGLSADQCAEYARAIFRQLDALDGSADGRIEWKAFRAFYKRCLATEQARKDLAAKAAQKLASSQRARERAREAFARYDVDGSGTLSQQELSALLRGALGNLAAELTDDEWEPIVADAMRRGDKDANGSWDVDEFEVFFSACLANDRLVRAYERKLKLRYDEAHGTMEADLMVYDLE